MNKEQAHNKQMRKSARKRKRFGIWSMLKLTVLLLVLGFGLFVISGKTFKLPKWMQTRIEQELNGVLPKGDVQFGSLDFRFVNGIKPTIGVYDLVLKNAENAMIARVNSLSAALSPTALFAGKVHATNVRLDTASISLKRAKNGEFDLGFGVEIHPGPEDQRVPTATLAELLDSIDRAFEAPVLAAIQTVELNNLTLNFLDARARRGWLFSGGSMRLLQDENQLNFSFGFDLNSTEKDSTSVAFTFETEKGSAGAKFGARIKGVSAHDLASQIPALAWLGALDAPISGALRAAIGNDGLLGEMDGTLEIGQGLLNPNAQAKPIAFNSGRAYFGFDSKKQKIRFDELSVETNAGKLVAEGHAYLREITDGVPAVMLGQLRILEGRLDPEGIFANPVVISGGAADIQLRLSPFALKIGQAVVEDGDFNYRIKGNITADKTGWHVALDAKTDRISPDRLLAFWPLVAVPNTRNWLVQNLIDANIFNVNGVLRFNSGEKPVFALGYEFKEAQVRFMKHLPPVLGGSGHSVIAKNVFTVVVDAGAVTAPTGGTLDVTGTVFKIHDLENKGPPATVYLKAKGPLPAALSLLDQPPFNILSKSGQPVDLAGGMVAASGEIHLRLLKKITVEDVDYDIAANLTNVSSDKLVKGRVLRAKKLSLIATTDELAISGAGLLGKVPVQGRWQQKMGPESRGVSQLEGTVELSQRFVDEFSIGLPKGSVSGAGVGQIKIDLRRNQPPKFRLVSDLNRLGLRLPEMGWALSRSGKGRLEVVGVLGDVARVDKLVIKGAGLDATGKVTLTAEGGLKAARFSRVRLAGWLDAPIELTGRGKGKTPSIKVLGGLIDTRKASFGGGSGGPSQGSAGKLTVALDRLIISDGISLTGFRGDFSRRNGLNGKFTAKVNGKAAVSGVVVPTTDGSAYRIKSKNAGAVFQAAGILDKARKGSMDLTLVPRKGAIGQYNGQLVGKSIRIRGAPAMADLLSAISGVGLLQQLNGNGIMFSNYQVRFRLTPRQVVITSGSAAGASMGVSMSGVYNLASSTIDVRGVLSPIYFLNGIGQIFSRRGEGLFGFNYRMVGPADNPKVRVNPLSIFTPGMFREIFKRPPPKVLQ